MTRQLINETESGETDKSIYPAEVGRVVEFILTQTDDEERQLAILCHSVAFLCAGRHVDKDQCLINLGESLGMWEADIEKARAEIDRRRADFKTAFPESSGLAGQAPMIDFRSWAKRK